MQLKTSCIRQLQNAKFLVVRDRVDSWLLVVVSQIVSLTPYGNLTLRECFVTLVGGSVKMKLTLPKLGLGSPKGLPKFQSSIAGVKTPRIGVSFISLERYQSLDVENGLVWAIWTSAAQVMAKRRAGSQTNNLIPDIKSRELTQPWCVQVKCDTLLESSRGELQVCFDFIPIESLSKELWPCKVPGVQTEIISGLLLANPETKNHSNVGATERHIVYCMEEGGGFPRVRAMVNPVSPELPVACPSTKGVLKNDLTNLLVGLMQVRISK